MFAVYELSVVHLSYTLQLSDDGILPIMQGVQEFKVDLEKYVWDFKIGDNIMHNYAILFKLNEDRSNHDDTNLYNKLMVIQCVSIIESLLYDLIVRLDSATNHFPDNIKSISQRKNEIKSKIDEDKVDKIMVDEFGIEHEYKRVKNYRFPEIISFCEDFNLLGGASRADIDVYDKLKELGRLRNRIHIQNWFGNFEIDDSSAFSLDRVNEAVELFQFISRILSQYYPRPWPATPVSVVKDS